MRGDVITKIVEGTIYREVKDLDNVVGGARIEAELQPMGDPLEYLGDLMQNVEEMSLQGLVEATAQEKAQEEQEVAAPWIVMSPEVPTEGQQENDEHYFDRIMEPCMQCENSVGSNLFGEDEYRLSPIFHNEQEKKLTTTPVFLDSSSEDSDDDEF